MIDEIVSTGSRGNEIRLQGRKRIPLGRGHSRQYFERLITPRVCCSTAPGLRPQTYFSIAIILSSSNGPTR
jgi:hypothetical protein